MSPLDALLWIAAAFGALIILTILVFVIVIIWAAIVGLRRMDQGEDKPDTEIFKSGGDS